jgi:branched-chain amino acid transport system ATP-binding protein
MRNAPETPTATTEGSAALPYEDREPILKTESLEVTYNRVALAVQDVSLTVPAASIVAILGANGAGKTTTLRALTGYLPGENAAITSGRVLLHGKLQNGRTPYAIARDGMSLVPERNKVFASLTVDENLAAVPTRPGGNRAAMEEIISEVFPALADLRRHPAGLLSGGERQMLAISRALIADPLVLLVDELSLGIAPVLVVRLMHSLEKIRTLRGASILLVEQNAAAALQVADHAYIMQNGRVVLEGSSAELTGHPAVRRLYLGQGEGGEQKAYGSRERGSVTGGA